MEELIKIGLIVKPQGIKGQLKVTPYTDDINRFKKIKQVVIENQTYRVTNVIVGGGFLLLSLLGVEDRNLAETLRNKYVCVYKKDLPPIKKDTYFIIDVIGCKILTDLGEEIGTVTDVTSARTDIFTVNTCDGRVMRFPFLKDLVINVDIPSKTITLSAKRLGEVSCYEN